MRVSQIGMNVNPQRSTEPAPDSDDGASDFIVEFQPEEMEQMDALAEKMGVPVEDLPALLIKLHLLGGKPESDPEEEE